MGASHRRHELMLLTSGEILLILDLIAEKYGAGYSDEPSIGRLQVKLSCMLEVLSQQGEGERIKT